MNKNQRIEQLEKELEEIKRDKDRALDIAEALKDLVQQPTLIPHPYPIPYIPPKYPSPSPYIDPWTRYPNTNPIWITNTTSTSNPSPYITC